MTDPRWRDAAPRPPYSGAPGPDTRSSRGGSEPGPGPRKPGYQPQSRRSDRPGPADRSDGRDRPDRQPSQDDAGPWNSWHAPGKWASRQEPDPYERDRDPYRREADLYRREQRGQNFRPPRREPVFRPSRQDPDSAPSLYDPAEPDDYDSGGGRSSQDDRTRFGPEDGPPWREPGEPRASRRRPPPPGRTRRRERGLSGGIGICVVLGAAVVGAIVTVAARKDPGNLLGAFLIAGTLAAASAVRQRSLYLLVPAPALAYLLTALVAGLLHDPAARRSRSALTADATQWIASGFLTMAAATAVALGFALARWYLSRSGTGQSGEPAGRDLGRIAQAGRRGGPGRPGEAGRPGGPGAPGRPGSRPGGPGRPATGSAPRGF